MTLLAAVWVTAIGPIVIGFAAGVAIGLLIRVAINYFSKIEVVGVLSPIAIMEVGGTDIVRAQLFFKPRFTTVPVVPVPGNITFYKDAATGVIYSLSNSGSSHTVPANLTASETLTGVQVGVEVMGVSGSDSGGTAFDAVGVEVHVVATQPGWMTFYRLAIKHAIEWWETGLLGNLRININSSPPGGLCDEWMDWAADWLANLNREDICKIEKCLSANGSHNYLRITLCDGTVFYLDPWINPDDPVFSQGDYEHDHGLPSDASVHWQR